METVLKPKLLWLQQSCSQQLESIIVLELKARLKLKEQSGNSIADDAVKLFELGRGY